MMINCYQTGRTMIEMLGVLAIIGIISVGGLDMFSKAMLKRKIGEVQGNVTMLAMQSRRLACQYVTAYGSYTKMLYRAKAYPEVLEYDSENVKFVGLLGEEYQIDSVKNGSIENAFFTIKISKLTDEACLPLASGNFGSLGTNGFQMITINDNEMDHPVTIAEATAKCVRTNNGNEIVLKYRACENNAAGLY